MDDDEVIKQQIIDEEHLRLLSLFHYISGGLTIAFSSLFIFHLIFFTYFAFNPELFPVPTDESMGPDPKIIVQFFSIVIGTFITLGIIYGILQIMSGRFIRQKRHRIFSFVVALPNVLFIPYGTLLCIFTLIVIERKSVKALYQKADSGMLV